MLTDSERYVPETRSRRKGGSLAVRLVPLVFAAVLASAVAGGLWNAAGSQQGGAPQNLGVYRLTEATVGPEAVAQMSRLHGKGVGVVDGYVAHYEGPSGGAVLYVGAAASEKEAATLLRRMEERIGTGNQYFTNLRQSFVEGVPVYAVRSGSETHYFWQMGKNVIWLGFDRDDPTGLAIAVKGLR